METTQIEKEKKELKNLIESINYEKYNFYIPYGDNKFIFGITAPNNEDNKLSEFFEIKTIFDTIKNIDEKINYSLKKGIEYIFSEDVYNNFNLLHESSDNEKKGYYYIENAIFRLSTLWDMIAHVYNIICGFKQPTDSIYVKRFFTQMHFQNDTITGMVNNILSYINENDDTSEPFPNWKGNYNYICEYRNKMTHRNSPSIASFSNLDINLKEPIVFLCTRTILDYVAVSQFMNDILDFYIKESKNIERKFNL